jgi:dienelactone hydrolase
MDLADSTRDDPFLTDGTKRELLVRFWYPADLSRGCSPAEYTSPRVWSYFSKLSALPLPEVRTNSCLEAPITEGAHPVVVFTHGYTATFTDYSFIFEDLASRGYVVASVDHTYEATAVEFPNGRFVKSVLGSHIGNTWGMDDQSMSLALAARSEDLNFVVNELERLNTADSPFTGKLDTSRIGVMGHSLGGEAALSAIKRVARFRAGVLIDAVLTDTPPAGTDRAILILAAGREQWSESDCRLWDQLRGPRLALNLRGAEHVTPSDLVWLAEGAVKTGPMGPEKTIAAVRDYIAAFLDTNLRGTPLDRLLSGPSPEYPDAVVTTQEQPLCTNVISSATKR